MADQVLRDELLKSDRWLDLPSDTDRLSFVGMLLWVDDFGNMEAGLRRVFRGLREFTQVKNEESVAVVLTHLVDADLIRPYSAGGCDYYHVPRFRAHRQYLVRKCAASPWDAVAKLGKDRRVEIRGKAKYQSLAENVVTTSHIRSNDVAEGVGVGVGVEVKPKPSCANAAAFDAFWSAYPRKKNKGDARKAWTKLKPSSELVERIMSAMTRAKTSEDWVRAGGRYVPHPASWLNAEGWEDASAVESPLGDLL